MPDKSTVLIKLLHKMVVYIINKDHIRKLSRCNHAFEKLSLIILSFDVYFKMAASIGSHFENIKWQYLEK